jgi:hypothetical protein
MSEPTMTELLVAIGRIEEMLRGMSEDLRKLQASEDQQWKKLNEHQTEIELLKQRQAPRVHWVAWIAAIAAGTALILGVFDRIYL